MAICKRRMINPSLLYDLYVNQKKSLPEISREIGYAISTVRLAAIENGIPLRTPSDGVRLSAPRLSQVNKGKHLRGVKWSPETRAKHQKFWSQRAKGISKKPNGYVEFTTSRNKGKSQHRVIMEEFLGRPLTFNEVVHHINGNRSDNRIENLQLMTRSEHTAYHRKIQLKK